MGGTALILSREVDFLVASFEGRLRMKKAPPE
jgi:hypothetical protein